MNEPGNRPEKTVLVVDDEAPLLQSIKQAFSRSAHYDYKVKTARSVAEILRNDLWTEPVDVLVLDLKLLGPMQETFSGFYLAERADHPAALMVIYSGFYTVENWAKAVICGADFFVPKDLKEQDSRDQEFTPRQLVKAIDLVLEARDSRRQMDVQMRPVLDRHIQDWHEEYAGMCVGIVGEEVVASGPTRLHVLAEYDKYRRKHEDAPKEPYMIGIDAKQSPGPISSATPKRKTRRPKDSE